MAYTWPSSQRAVPVGPTEEGDSGPTSLADGRGRTVVLSKVIWRDDGWVFEEIGC